MVERQEIIDKAINIEIIISALITAKYFPGELVNSDFLQEVLYDPLASAAFKVNIFEKCYSDVPKKTIESMRRLFNIRNIYAHCGLSMSSKVDPDQSGVMNPKKKNQPLDFEDLKSEFFNKEKNIVNVLFDLIKESGMIFSKEAPFAPKK